MKETIKTVLTRVIPVMLQPRLKATYKRLSYFGFRYQCPFCNSHLKMFLPFGIDVSVFKEKKIVGGGYRQNALYPICNSLDRERLIYLYLLHKTDIFHKYTKLLHIAPEARLSDILRSKVNIDYLSADIC